jgi:hypothetical protein
MGANKTLRMGLLLSLLSTAALSQASPHLKVTIVIYDSAHVGAKTLGRTERIAGTILQTAEIESRWDTGPVQDLGNLGTDFTAYSRGDCEHRPTSAILRVHILPRAPSGVAAQALGYSLPCPKGGVQVTIFADRAATVSEMGGPTFGRVLGYAIAHELGHVLLHSGAHDAAGLMKGIWSKRDWQRAAVSIIPFSPTDVQRIAALHQRVADRAIPELASLHPH